jgi:ubiquinone/menaquinone biosynthesis C-methylase UbiE
MSFHFNDEQVLAYHQSTTDQLEDLNPLLESHFFQGAQSLLDIGCGDGKDAAFLARQFPNMTIVGCDISANMIAFASKTFPPKEYPNLTFLQKNACDIGFIDQFDRVISFNSLHWVKKQSEVFREIYSCLKPAGKAYLVVAHKSAEDDLQTICRKIILSWKWIFSFWNFRPVHSFHTQKEYEQIISHQGFRIENIQQGHKPVVFKDRSTLERLLIAVLTPLYHLPSVKRASFLNDLFASLSQNGNIDPKNQIHIAISQTKILISKPSF